MLIRSICCRMDCCNFPPSPVLIFDRESIDANPALNAKLSACFTHRSQSHCSEVDCLCKQTFDGAACCLPGIDVIDLRMLAVISAEVGPGIHTHFVFQPLLGDSLTARTESQQTGSENF